VHVWGDSVPPASFVEGMRADSMFVVPTLAVQSSVGGEPAGTSLLDDARMARFLDQDARANLGRAFPVMPTSRASYAAASASVALLSEHAVPVLVGSDAPNPGTWYGATVHDELLRLVRDAGFSPVEALRAATSATAASFDLRDRGRVDIGLRADLLLVDGDPTTDITATRAIVGVWKRGRPFDRAAYAQRVSRSIAAAEAASAAIEVPAHGILLSDFEDGAPSSTMGRWVVSTDQLAGGQSTGQFAIVGDGTSGGHALAVTGIVAPGLPYAWSGVLLFPAAQPMQPVDLSGARGVAFRARGAGMFQVALFTQRGGQVPAVVRFETTDAWQDYELAWTDFGAHDGADVQGIGILAGPQPGEFQFTIDDVRLVR
jgi:hypothetical protein